jgi:hypothetical protein
MPVKSCELDTKPGFKWGDENICYIYDPNDKISKEKARRKALKQGIAITISQQKSK